MVATKVKREVGDDAVAPLFAVTFLDVSRGVFSLELVAVGPVAVVSLCATISLRDFHRTSACRWASLTASRCAASAWCTCALH